MVDADFERELIEALPLNGEDRERLLARPGDDRRDVVQEAALRAWVLGEPGPISWMIKRSG